MTLKGKAMVAGAMLPLAFLCAVCMLFAPTLAAAEDTATAQVEGSYTVSIPAALTIDADSSVAAHGLDSTAHEQGTMQITGMLEANKTLSVTATSQHGGHLVSAEGARLSYTLDGGDFTVSAGDASQEISQTVTAVLTQEAIYAGTYSDVVTFTMTCEDNAGRLVFDAQGGVLQEAPRDVVVGEPYGELPVPTRDGYQFIGWFTAPADGSQVSAQSAMTAGAVTLYARWEPNGVVSSDENDEGSGAVAAPDGTLVDGAVAALPNAGGDANGPVGATPGNQANVSGDDATMSDGDSEANVGGAPVLSDGVDASGTTPASDADGEGAASGASDSNGENGACVANDSDGDDGACDPIARVAEIGGGDADAEPRLPESEMFTGGEGDAAIEALFAGADAPSGASDTPGQETPEPPAEEVAGTTPGDEQADPEGDVVPTAEG